MRILLVEDDLKIASFVIKGLRAAVMPLIMQQMEKRASTWL